MLKYKALWIDDSMLSAEPKIEGIRDFLEEEAITFEPILRENAVDIDSCLGDPELDIIITDFNGVDVTELINKIQTLEKYIDLVLYSENPPPEFYEVSRSIPGIYPCTRDDVEDTIRKVIQSTIRRTQNVTNMRGIVISEAIDIENQIADIIVSYFSEKGDIIKRSLKRDNFDFGKKVMLLGSISKKIMSTQGKDNDEFKQINTLVKLLFKEVVWPRNVLSHVKHEIDTNGQAVLTSDIKSPDGDKTITINAEWYKETRKKLARHSDNLKAFMDFIAGDTVQ
ncbi:MAG: hypothetical protein ACETWQ_17570 [Phycisphaerae bacterium]